MCDDCAELRRDPPSTNTLSTAIYTPAICSGCKTAHLAFLFSHLERQKRDQRVCIGRQGHIRLCAHRKISYADVTQIFSK